MQGVISHQCGSLLTLSADNAKYLQLYFTGDEKRECRERCRLNKGGQAKCCPGTSGDAAPLQHLARPVQNVSGEDDWAQLKCGHSGRQEGEWDT